MKKIIFLVCLLAACATTTLNSRIDLGYKAITAYVDQAGSLLSRGRITVSQARQVSANAKRAKQALDFAAGVGKICPAEPCTAAGQLQVAETVLLGIETDLKLKEANHGD